MAPPRSVPVLRVKRFTFEEIQQVLEGLPGHVGHKEGPFPDGGFLGACEGDRVFCLGIRRGFCMADA